MKGVARSLPDQRWYTSTTIKPGVWNIKKNNNYEILFAF